MNDVIVKSVTRAIIPFVQLYGIYTVLFGHVSPGGGFAGGAMIGTSLILYTLVFGSVMAKQKFSHQASELAETGGILIYVGVGLVALLVGLPYLSNLAAGFLPGVPGTLLSAGMIPILMIAIGVKVASTMITLFYKLIAEVKA
jgi:multicomponent Na+:H+ antiporter subunit B